MQIQPVNNNGSQPIYKARLSRATIERLSGSIEKSEEGNKLLGDILSSVKKHGNRNTMLDLSLQSEEKIGQYYGSAAYDYMDAEEYKYIEHSVVIRIKNALFPKQSIQLSDTINANDDIVTMTRKYLNNSSIGKWLKDMEVSLFKQHADSIKMSKPDTLLLEHFSKNKNLFTEFSKAQTEEMLNYAEELDKTHIDKDVSALSKQIKKLTDEKTNKLQQKEQVSSLKKQILEETTDISEVDKERIKLITELA